jgi:hypothetical protein
MDNISVIEATDRIGNFAAALRSFAAQIIPANGAAGDVVVVRVLTDNATHNMLNYQPADWRE